MAEELSEEAIMIRYFVAAVIFALTLVVGAVLLDEIVDGFGERSCIENIGVASKDGYDVCDL